MNDTTTPVALSIAGSDSGAGAGIQADLKTFAAHGVYGLSAITAITAQNTVGVTRAEALSPALVTAQIDALAADFRIRATKTGMLATSAIVDAVAAAVARHAFANLVVDPVMVAKSGDALLDLDARDAVVQRLLPLAMLVTPNIPETEALAGLAIRDTDDCREAARRILAFGPRAVLIKGGHLPSAGIVDRLYSAGGEETFPAARVPGRHTHGTGCTFAAAIASHLALGRTVQEAIPLAQAYLAGAIRQAPGLGRGHGPMQHFWQWRSGERERDGGSTG